MTAHDVLGCLAAFRREANLFARAMLDQPIALHALERGCYRRRAHIQALCQPRGDHRVSVACQVMQDLQVVLNDRRGFAGVARNARLHAPRV